MIMIWQGAAIGVIMEMQLAVITPTTAARGSSLILTDDGNCPVTPVVQMLQGKWKLQILYELCIKCPMRFGELKKVLKPITNTALTNALKDLEADELVQRIQYNEIPLRVEYSLTEKGRDLLPVFYAISQWGMKYIT